MNLYLIWPNQRSRVTMSNCWDLFLDAYNVPHMDHSEWQLEGIPTPVFYSLLYENAFLILSGPIPSDWMNALGPFVAGLIVDKGNSTDHIVTRKKIRSDYQFFDQYGPVIKFDNIRGLILRPKGV